MLVPINLSGGDDSHVSRPLSAQKTRNFWPQLQKNQKEKSPYVLQSFYGLKAFGSNSAGASRGMFQNRGILYRAAGDTFYRVDSSGAHSALGHLPGTGRCIFDAIGSDITIVTNGQAHEWKASALTQIAELMPVAPNSCAAINNQMLFDEGSGQTFQMSDAGDATSINGLNYGAAEDSPDELDRIAVFKQTAYMMGKETIELWWDSGQGNPPLSRLQGGIINNGIGAIYSVAKNDDFLFFFGSDKQAHAVTGGAAAVDNVISTPAMAREFQGYADTSDAIGWCMQLEGQWFYAITFPTANKTWCFPIGGEWFEWGTGLAGRIRANDYAFVFGKHIVDDYAGGNLYELDPAVYTDAGSPIVRVRDSAPIHGGLFKMDGMRIEMSRFELLMETGIGLVSGQGSDPEVMLSWSDDGGKTFSHERRGKVGRQGAYKKIIWQNLGSFYERVLRISISDPVFCCIYSAAMDVDACI